VKESSFRKPNKHTSLQKWIMDNIDTVNDLSARGFIPERLENDYLLFKQVGYPVTYSYDPEMGTIMRVDRIYESL
jgi:hypothetical protein